MAGGIVSPARAFETPRSVPVEDSGRAACRACASCAPESSVADSAAPMTFDAARVVEHAHGHLGWLAAAVLAHPGFVLWRGKRKAHFSVACAAVVPTLAGALGMWVYGPYRDRVKQSIFIDARWIGLLVREEGTPRVRRYPPGWAGAAAYALSVSAETFRSTLIAHLRLPRLRRGGCPRPDGRGPRQPCRVVPDVLRRRRAHPRYHPRATMPLERLPDPLHGRPTGEAKMILRLRPVRCAASARCHARNRRRRGGPGHPPVGRDLVWTVDTQIEAQHFRRAWMSLQDIGWRSFVAAASSFRQRWGPSRGARLPRWACRTAWVTTPSTRSLEGRPRPPSR